jgi:fatty acid/phospholipid biosynthesis enzyme
MFREMTLDERIGLLEEYYEEQKSKNNHKKSKRILKHIMNYRIHKFLENMGNIKNWR